MAEVGIPRGPHGLSREQVAARQRRRLLDAVTAEVAERTYAGATVTRIAKAAGVSLSTFYEAFPGKEDAFLAGADDVAERLTAAVAPAVLDAGSPSAALDAVFAGIAGFWRDHPADAVAYLVEIRAAGLAAREQRAVVNRRFSVVVQELIRQQAQAAGAEQVADSALVEVAADCVVALSAEFNEAAVRTGDFDEALRRMRAASRLLLSHWVP